MYFFCNRILQDFPFSLVLHKNTFAFLVNMYRNLLTFYVLSSYYLHLSPVAVFHFFHCAPAVSGQEIPKNTSPFSNTVRSCMSQLYNVMQRSKDRGSCFLPLSAQQCQIFRFCNLHKKHTANIKARLQKYFPLNKLFSTLINGVFFIFSQAIKKIFLFFFCRKLLAKKSRPTACKTSACLQTYINHQNGMSSSFCSAWHQRLYSSSLVR